MTNEVTSEKSAEAVQRVIFAVHDDYWGLLSTKQQKVVAAARLGQDSSTLSEQWPAWEDDWITAALDGRELPVDNFLDLDQRAHSRSAQVSGAARFGVRRAARLVSRLEQEVQRCLQGGDPLLFAGGELKTLKRLRELDVALDVLEFHVVWASEKLASVAARASTLREEVRAERRPLQKRIVAAEIRRWDAEV